ncbi:MAG: tetratricopeptide repeat protein [Victivallaceae bacterium]|nr:tetratricopeptide repeat protein [Victivallaceae bacterium]
MKFCQKIVLISSFIFIALTANSQTLVEAFKKSYALEKVGQYSKAIESLSAHHDKNSYEVNLRLGWLNYLAGRFTKSIAYYSQAINLMPLSVEAQLGIIYPASSVGNWAQVIKAYNKILEIDPKNYTANYKLGYINYYKKNYKQAFTYFQQGVNLYPFDYNNLLMYAWTNYQLGKRREAKILFNKVLLNNPDDSSALEGLKLIK